MADQTQHRTAAEALPASDVDRMIIFIGASLNEASLYVAKSKNTPVNFGKGPLRLLAERLLLKGVKTP